MFHSSTLREFSTLTNVQELFIDDLDIPSFIPGIQRYFGQFSPTLRSLTLREPKGPDRQVVFFIGLFPHLKDLELRSSRLPQKESTGDLELVPPSVPPLRGRLTGRYFGGAGLAKTMISLFGGVQFSHMDLSSMDGAQRLLYACANTLETLQLSVLNLRGERVSSKGIHGFS